MFYALCYLQNIDLEDVKDCQCINSRNLRTYFFKLLLHCESTNVNHNNNNATSRNNFNVSYNASDLIINEKMLKMCMGNQNLQYKDKNKIFSCELMQPVDNINNIKDMILKKIFNNKIKITANEIGEEIRYISLITNELKNATEETRDNEIIDNLKNIFCDNHKLMIATLTLHCKMLKNRINKEMSHTSVHLTDNNNDLNTHMDLSINIKIRHLEQLNHSLNKTANWFDAKNVAKDLNQLLLTSMLAKHIHEKGCNTKSSSKFSLFEICNYLMSKGIVIESVIDAKHGIVIIFNTVKYYKKYNHEKIRMYFYKEYSLETGQNGNIDLQQYHWITKIEETSVDESASYPTNNNEENESRDNEEDTQRNIKFNNPNSSIFYQQFRITSNNSCIFVVLQILMRAEQIKNTITNISIDKNNEETLTYHAIKLITSDNNHPDKNILLAYLENQVKNISAAIVLTSLIQYMDKLFFSCNNSDILKKWFNVQVIKKYKCQECKKLTKPLHCDPEIKISLFVEKNMSIQCLINNYFDDNNNKANNIICNKCDNQNIVTSKKIDKYSPPYLIIQLDRINKECYVHMNETLIIYQNFFKDANAKAIVYELIGVLHERKKQSGNNYYRVQLRKENKWHDCNINNEELCKNQKICASLDNRKHCSILLYWKTAC